MSLSGSPLKGRQEKEKEKTNYGRRRPLALFFLSFSFFQSCIQGRLGITVPPKSHSLAFSFSLMAHIKRLPLESQPETASQNNHRVALFMYLMLFSFIISSEGVNPKKEEGDDVTQKVLHTQHNETTQKGRHRGGLFFSGVLTLWRRDFHRENPPPVSLARSLSRIPREKKRRS